MDIFADDGAFRIADLPVHPLLVHAAVVLTPLTALAVAVAALWPAARQRLGWGPPIAALIVAVLIPATTLSGESLADAVGRTPAVERHEALGLMLIPWSIALLITSLAVTVSDRMLTPVRHAHAKTARVIAVVVRGAAVMAATGTVVVTVLTGDAGARAVWGGV